MSPLTQLIVPSAFLFVLVAVIVVVVLRFRAAARESATGATRMSEEAFAAMTMREVLGSRAGGTRAGGTDAASAASGAPAVLDDIPTGILIADEAGIVRSLNARARALLALPSPGTGRTFRDLLAGSPEVLDVVDRAFRGRRGVPRERVRPGDSGPDGTADVRRLEIEAAPVTRGGEFRGVACTIADATTESAAREIDEQRRLDRQMATLASDLSHELANSLTATHGYARMIDASKLSEIDRTSLAAIQEESASMTHTIEAFRRVVRPLTPLRDRVPVAMLVRDVVGALQEEMGLAADAITTDVPSGLAVSGDRVLLEDALGQVVRNAVEACREARCEVAVTIAARHAPEHRLAVISVRDAGPGVPDEDRGRLFDPFFSTKADHPGLGLTHARHIVVAHEGRLEAVHPADGGLVISMALPLAETAP